MWHSGQQSQDEKTHTPYFSSPQTLLFPKHLQGEQTISKYISTRIPHLSKCLYKHCCLLDSNKTIYCWKELSRGQLQRSDVAFHPPESTAKLTSEISLNSKLISKIKLHSCLKLTFDWNLQHAWLGFLILPSPLVQEKELFKPDFPISYNWQTRSVKVHAVPLLSGHQGWYGGEVLAGGFITLRGQQHPPKGHLHPPAIAGLWPPSIKRVNSRCITDT